MEKTYSLMELPTNLAYMEAVCAVCSEVNYSLHDGKRVIYPIKDELRIQKICENLGLRFYENGEIAGGKK